MHFNKPYHQYDGNKDQVCTLTSLFHIRNNKLNMTLNMRSNDVILGFMTDFTFFNILHQQAYLHLKEHYPELEMGSYTHTSHSMHLYARHYDKVKDMLTEPFEPHSTPLLNTSIRTKNSRIKADYIKVFVPILGDGKLGEKIETDNNIINWCYEKL
jgi:thymidylate synthase